MAAEPLAQIPELVDLWQVRAQDLNALLEEETADWRRELSWDFQASADLVRRFVDVRALNGYALMIGDEPAGYSYFVCEEHKGLVGDLYVRERFRSSEHEHLLLRAVVDHLMRTRYVHRIESQLMLARSLRVRYLPGAGFQRSYQRNFMMFEAQLARRLPPKRLDNVVLDRWGERRQDETAQLIASAYRGHIDSEINDQYRSPAGARRFLFNIVQYPGCGNFYPPAAWIALHRETGRLCGVSLTSMVAPDVGHITQICVGPGAKGQGVGYELLRQSLCAFAEAGAVKVSLTVTTANVEAVRLYESVGFHVVRQFPALVWEGF
jgi:ribosomal protein S18 acetylase RimI-like enzyme